ncbi:HPP family protein [Halomicrobium urmianum]|uniref:HPP family protein n=1 Tax=Halomicrobium urmianum TaxID=1586233 RepID=UPI001CD968DE|nr:HPP family protein [Halomicrobium urmianum]
MRDRARAALRRLRRLERREGRDLRAWLETTSAVVHVSALLFVPLLVALVTYLSTQLEALSFLLFPPLAAGSYTLFTDPKGQYASPVRFVGGLTVGAVCGLLAATASDVLLPGASAGALEAIPFEAALATLLAGAVTWLFSVEEPSAYSAALLGLLVPRGQRTAFVASVLAASLLVAAVFILWRRHFYERRAQFLYHSLHGDDHVLVPMWGDRADATAMLAARLAAAHDAGKVVLLDLAESPERARAERTRLAADSDVRLPTDVEGEPAAEGDDGVAAAVEAIEERARRIETKAGVPCQVVVADAGGDVSATIREAADRTNCDLVAAPYESRHGKLSGWIRDLFRADVDVLVHRSTGDRRRWKRILVPVRSTSDVAHSMVDFAQRLAGQSGRVSVATCVRSDASRRRAENMLADLVDPFDAPIETRVARASIESFLADEADRYDLVFMGASRDRSAASRLIAPPTFERIRDLDADVAVVDRG